MLIRCPFVGFDLQKKDHTVKNVNICSAPVKRVMACFLSSDFLNFLMSRLNAAVSTVVFRSSASTGSIDLEQSSFDSGVSRCATKNQTVKTALTWRVLRSCTSGQERWLVYGAHPNGPDGRQSQESRSRFSSRLRGLIGLSV